MEQFNKVTSTAALLGLSAVFVSLTAGAATSASTEFSATIAYEGACDITVPTTVVFNSGDAVLPSLIEAGNAVAKKTFDLTLANCQGLGVTPKITVAGESNSKTGETLFLDATASTATGYGILLATDGNANFKANINLAKVNTISASDDWDTDTRLTTINGTVPMSATLSCGDCETEGRLGGELKSNVTFEFQYD
ncbi:MULTISPECIES: fimbrial protein [Providencia]|uniref:fimbrial protein n=1 Tax=Providencia TaxID=586 RepID=UPI00083856E2|nr:MULTISPECIES: fimbrial protein [Providencia]MBP6120833.1 fimbrial protein [Providencia sp.]NIH23292.1 fimbrial protein [Providencia heimbachae]